MLLLVLVVIVLQLDLLARRLSDFDLVLVFPRLVEAMLVSMALRQWLQFFPSLQKCVQVVELYHVVVLLDLVEVELVVMVPCVEVLLDRVLERLGEQGYVVGVAKLILLE